ncbi:transmembrane E3 ubiquitin-protein ligase [Entomortierella parvispora]|uniref:RING-type E3 ubiquitin transferase n=1 Tax=Entomortierella parvispora TaxID=205924 RepID=A0A9P3H6B8_9FUNG|nr:transmembrane E3 ubiquitin-protein ligase [Entomortierella parvispora]
MEEAVGRILAAIVILWFINLSREAPQDHVRQILGELRNESLVFGNRTFGHNVSYPIPQVVTTELDRLFVPHPGHYYHNITGSFKGKWDFDDSLAKSIDQQIPPLPRWPVDGEDPKKNGTETESGNSGDESSVDKKPRLEDRFRDLKDKEGGQNDTIEATKPQYQEDFDIFKGPFQFNRSGTFSFSVRETKATEQVNWVRGTWRLKHEDGEDNGISLKVLGVHFVLNGSFYMWGVPEGANIPMWRVLDLMPNQPAYDLAAAAIKDQYEKQMKSLQNVLDGHEQLDTPEMTLSEPSLCTYQMYMQLGAVDSSIRSSLLKDLEREWAAPQGISTIKAPELNSSLFMYSPNCRLTIGVKDAEGLKREKFYFKAVNYALMAGTVAFIQVFLLVRQMEYTTTPSSVCKVSYWSIAIQVFLDSYLCMFHLTTGVLVDYLFIPFVASSFFSFVLVAIFGMRYMLVIWRIQRPERRGRRNRAAAERAATAAANATTPAAGSRTDTMPGGLPLPVTAARTTPVVEDDSPRSDMRALYSRFYWMLLASLITLYEIAVSSTRIQNVMISISALLLYSFWIPQIIRNVSRGSKRGLSHLFVLGMSVTRLVIPVYFYGCPGNLMGHDATPWIWGLVLWVALQTSVLLLQDWLGPRFFIPKKYLPPVYDYHPVLPAPTEEGGAGHGRHQDCAICMLPIDTTSSSTGAGARLSSVVGSLGRLNYMLTPCGHLFHTECLERWMRIKLECPNCRTFLVDA